MANGKPNGVLWRTGLEWILRFAGMAALAAFGFLSSVLMRFDQRLDKQEQAVVSIQASRFTASDGTAIQRQLATLVTRAELADDLSAIREDLREVRTLLIELQRKGVDSR